MILTRFAKTGQGRPVDLQDAFAGQTAMLVGAAPSLREQPIELLNQRGVLAMAMNNAATHFRPTLWVSGDHPACYDPQILRDPGIMKFGPLTHARAPLDQEKLGGPGKQPAYATMPNMYFYTQEANVPWDEYLGSRHGVPWYSNTLLVGINILYMLGIRRIILAGSDFGFSSNAAPDAHGGDMYAHKTRLGTLERKWNLDLYNSLVKELRQLKPIFDKAGLTLMDSSKNSRISQVYEHISLEKAVDICLTNFPKEMVDPSTLPHCSKYAPESIQKRIANWPGHRVLGLPGDQGSVAAEKEEVL